nr:hypothetical protein [Deinococcus sp.]
MHDPDLMVLDEPTTGLDVQSRRAVWTYLQALRRETGLSLLLTTHQIEDAEDADLVAIIDRGKVLAFGTPQSLREGLGKVVTLQGVPDDVRAGLRQGVPDTVMDEVGDTLRLRMADPARSWRTSLRICRA